MARAKKHKDVEFMVSGPGEAKEAYFDSLDEASSNAIGRSIGLGGEEVTLDVLVSSKAGARWWAGDFGVEQYKEDPDASIFEQIRIKAVSDGMIP